MKAVIPAAKKKESLFPFSESKPTSLIPLKGEPLILQTINKLKNLGIDEIYVIVNYKEKMFRQVLEERTDVNIVIQEDLSGTAEALKQVDFIEEEFLVINGDVVISENDLDRLIQNHDSDLSLLATDESKAEKFGVLSIQNDEIVGMAEKPEEPENTLVNSGIYVLEPDIFGLIDGGGYSSLTKVINDNIEGFDCRFTIISDYWIDIGSPKKLWEADRVLRENELEPEISSEAEVSEKSNIGENVKVGKNAKIKDNVTVKGYTVISEGVNLDPNTVVRNSTLCKGTEIENADIDKSLILEDNIIDPYTRVEDTVLGEGTDIKSGTVIHESFIGPRSFIDMNNSVKGVKFVPDARTDISELSK
jgi:NDP-sugar pyrophosphorylase family protein